MFKIIFRQKANQAVKIDGLPQTVTSPVVPTVKSTVTLNNHVYECVAHEYYYERGTLTHVECYLTDSV